MTFPDDQNAPYARVTTFFRHSGFEHRQLKRQGNVAIYEQTKGKQNPAYEVVIIRYEPERRIGEKIILAGERYPTSEDWGSYGWTYTSPQEAEKKFNQLQIL